MAPVALLDELPAKELEPDREEPPLVGVRIGVVPEHPAPRAQPASLEPTVAPGVDDRQGEPAGDQPAVDPPKQRELLGERDVDDRVERHDRPEGPGREADLRHVRSLELPAGEQATGPLRLDVRQVDPRHLESPREPSTGGDARPTPQVQDRLARGELPHHREEPAPVLTVGGLGAVLVGTPGPVAVGPLVPPFAHELLELVRREAPGGNPGTANGRKPARRGQVAEV